MLICCCKFPLLDVRLRRDEEILWVLTQLCCEKRCMRHLSIEDLKYAEKRKQTGKQNYFLEILHQQSQLSESGEYKTVFFIRGKGVCREAWLQAHNLSKESFRRIMKKFKDGVTMVEHGNKGRKSVMSKTAECITWLQFFVNCIGDHQPDNGGIHLPSCFSKSDIYKKMLEENKSLNQPTISLSHFYSLWDKHFSHVIIPKVLQIFQSTFQSPLTSSALIFSA